MAPRIIVSGGSYAVAMGDAPAKQTEAMAMRQFLIALGVPEDRIVNEASSLNTIENMRETRALVGTGRVALVTSGYHMPRALRLARTAGLDAEAFPTDWQIVPTAAPFVGIAVCRRSGARSIRRWRSRNPGAGAFDYRGATVKADP